MDDPAKLGDDELLSRLDREVRGEREWLPYFIACLGVADSRRLPERNGYSSTFDYCVRRLKLSEDEAYKRIQAARAGARRPEILVSLEQGALSLSAVNRLAPHVRREDASDLIARAEGKSIRELDRLLAPLCPMPAKRDVVRTVAVVAPREAAPLPEDVMPKDGSARDGSLVALPFAKEAAPNGAAADGGAAARSALAASQPFAAPGSRVETRVDFSFRGSVALREAIERAKALLSHKYPAGRLEDVLLEIVEDYLARHDPQRPLRASRPGREGASFRIPAAVRRAVWARDGGRCSFIGAGGIRCGSRRFLELDHRMPRAIGGDSSADNLRLLCRSHNDAERRRILGEGDLSTNLPRGKSVDNRLGGSA